ncbi:hypothetical protein C8Q75DRAFT_794060 [Abortiporus biennis]|nr:hypothetical protein C8Q75DRAFT_794060 [Abortiporus biennis]
MNRRTGPESFLGIAGGKVSAESQRNLDIAEDLCARRRPKEAVPYLVKAMEDDANTDAWIQAAFLAPDLDTSCEMLRDAREKNLKKWLGTDCFEDGNNVIDTRPYMRVLQALVRLSFQNHLYEESAQVIIEMLRLSPNDNMGQRYWLGSILIRIGRYEDAFSFSQNWLDPQVLRSGEPTPRGGCVFSKPLSPKPLSQSRIDSMKYARAEFTYNSAFAAFKIWGDCELARQYLILSAKLSPNVLLKILARVDPPKSLNMSARPMNGPQDANDYLWLTQDAWMAEDVWNWANSAEEVKMLILKGCTNSSCSNKETRVGEFKRCSACHEVWYCSPNCQKADWQNHKPLCKERQRQKIMLKALTQPDMFTEA